MNDEFSVPENAGASSEGEAVASPHDNVKKGSSAKAALIYILVAALSVCLSVCFSLFAVHVYQQKSEEKSFNGQSDAFNALVNGATFANRSVVAISVFDENNERLGSGSGVIWSADGYIVTCDHVTDKGEMLVVTFTDGTRLEASLVGSDFTTDLSVIKVETAKELTPATASEASISLGQRIIAIGNSLGSYSNTVTDGVISAQARKITVEGRDMELIQMSAAVNPGNSGGGLFDGEGRLLGIVNAKASTSGMEGIGFAIPISRAIPVIEELIANGFVAGRPAVSFESVYISRANYAAYPELADFYTEFSWLGSSIVEGEYITDAGSTDFKVGDRIMSVNGAKVGAHSDVTSAVLSSSPGDVITISVFRSGQLQDVEVTVTEKTSK